MSISEMSSTLTLVLSETGPFLTWSHLHTCVLDIIFSCLKIGSKMTKEDRTSLHRNVRLAFPHLQTETIQSTEQEVNQSAQWYIVTLIKIFILHTFPLCYVTFMTSQNSENHIMVMMSHLKTILTCLYLLSTNIKVQILLLVSIHVQFLKFS